MSDDIKEIYICTGEEIHVFSSSDYELLSWVIDSSFSVYSSTRLVARFYKINYFKVKYE